MSGTTEHSEAADIPGLNPLHPDADNQTISECTREGEIARDPRETLKMKSNIESFFREMRR